MAREADLLELELVDDVADELAGLLVVEKQRRAVAVEHLRRLGDDPGEQRRQLELGGQVGDEVEEVDLAPALARCRSSRCSASRPVAHSRVMPSSSARSPDVKAPSTLFSSSATPIVSPFAFLIGAQRSDSVLKPVCSVDVAVEARVGVGVVDDLADAALVDGPAMPRSSSRPDLPRAEAGRDVGVQLAGLVVVEEDRARSAPISSTRRLEQRCRSPTSSESSAATRARQRAARSWSCSSCSTRSSNAGSAPALSACASSSRSRSAWIVACSWRTSSRCRRSASCSSAAWSALAPRARRAAPGSSPSARTPRPPRRRWPPARARRPSLPRARASRAWRRWSTPARAGAARYPRSPRG